MLTDPLNIPLEWKPRGSLPNSMALQYLHCVAPEEFTTDSFTMAIIDVDISQSKKKKVEKITYRRINRKWKKLSFHYKGVETTKKTLRQNLYENGFVVNNEEYVYLGRSASKARSKSALFIKKHLHEQMNQWMKVDLKFSEKDKIDIAANEAYDALVLSSTIGSVQIKPHEILLVEDITGDHKFKALSSIAYLDDEGNPAIKEESTAPKNLLWDGMGLADESLFEQAIKFNTKEEKPFRNKSFMLLRNKWFKSCVFHCRIQEYIKNNLGDVPYFIDMYRREIKASDVKLIITPSSLKFLKMSNHPYFFDREEYYQGLIKKGASKEKARKRADNTSNPRGCFVYWLDKMEPEFGICKTDERGGYARATYQFINSLPITRNEVKELVNFELEYVNKLRKDANIFREHIQAYNDSQSYDFIINLLGRNVDAQHTTLAKELRKRMVSQYREKLRHGNIRVPGAVNATMVNNPYQLLKYALFLHRPPVKTETIRKDGTIQRGTSQSVSLKFDPFLNGNWLVWCPAFEEGKELIIMRSPHISTGNVAWGLNFCPDNINDYFHLSNEIIVVNAWNTDIMNRLQGCDWDSDFAFCSDNPILTKAAKICTKILTPVNGFEQTKLRKKNTSKNLANIDHLIGNNQIGNICNMAQLLQSYYWDFSIKNHDDIIWYDGSKILFHEMPGEGDFEERKENLLKSIQNNISILSSFSQVEIDKPKKSYNASIWKYMQGLKKLPFIEKESGRKYEKGTLIESDYESLQDKDAPVYATIEDDEIVWPEFFRLIKETNCPRRLFNTPMDYLVEIINNNISGDEADKSRTRSVPIKNFVNPQYPSRIDRHRIENFRKKCSETYTEIERIRSKNDIDSYAAWKQIRELRKKVVGEVSSINLSENDLLAIIYKCFTGSKSKKNYYDEEIRSMAMFCLDVLHRSSHKIKFMDQFIVKHPKVVTQK